jgi:hypothetical protein
LRAGHRGHSLIGDQHRDLVAARAQLAQHLQGFCAGARTEDPEALAEAAAQVARNGRENGRLVIDGDDRGAPHQRRLGAVGDYGLGLRGHRSQ